MLEVIVHPLPDLTTEIVNSPIPIPGPDEVLVKVEVASSNVKGKISFRFTFQHNSNFPSIYAHSNVDIDSQIGSTSQHAICLSTAVTIWPARSTQREMS